MLKADQCVSLVVVQRVATKIRKTNGSVFNWMLSRELLSCGREDEMEADTEIFKNHSGRGWKWKFPLLRWVK